jgi:hypothetical protein
MVRVHRVWITRLLRMVRHGCSVLEQDGALNTHQVGVCKPALIEFVVDNATHPTLQVALLHSKSLHNEQ